MSQMLTPLLTDTASGRRDDMPEENNCAFPPSSSSAEPVTPNDSGEVCGPPPESPEQVFDPHKLASCG